MTDFSIKFFYLAFKAVLTAPNVILCNHYSLTVIHLLLNIQFGDEISVPVVFFKFAHTCACSRLLWYADMSRFSEYLPKEKQDELRATARAIIASGKGILAADESTGEWCEEKVNRVRSIVISSQVQVHGVEPSVWLLQNGLLASFKYWTLRHPILLCNWCGILMDSVSMFKKKLQA